MCLKISCFKIYFCYSCTFSTESAKYAFDPKVSHFWEAPVEISSKLAVGDGTSGVLYWKRNRDGVAGQRPVNIISWLQET